MGTAIGAATQGIAAGNGERLARALAGQGSAANSAQAQIPSITAPLDQRLYHTPADKKRKTEQARAWAAYKGRFPDPLKKTDPDKPNLNVKVNRCSPIVDKGVSFLFGQAVGIEVTAPIGGAKIAQSKLDALNEWLQQALGDEDDFMTLLTEIATNGAVFGQAFVKLLPADSDAGSDGASYPVMRNLNPEYLSVQTEPDDCKAPLAYCCEFATSDPTQPGVTITKRQIIQRVDPDTLADVYGRDDDDDRWLIVNYARREASGGPSTVDAGNTTAAVVRGGLDTSPSQGFVQVGEPEVWPYSWSPIVDCSNLPNPNEYWGTPDITPDVIHVNEALNLTESSIHSIGYSHGFPWLWTNSTLAGTKPTPGSVIELGDPQGSLNALMAAGDLPGLMAHAESLRADMDEQSRVPAVALGRLESLPKGNISGVALQLLFQPLLEKTTLKQRLYGKLIRALCQRLLLLGEQIATLGEVTIDLHWKPIMPADDLQAAQVAVALAGLGFISQETIMIGLGLSPDSEQNKLEDEAQKAADKAAKLAASQPPVAPMPAATVVPVVTPPNAQPLAPAAQQPAQPPNAPPVNHPAAIAARQKMQQAFNG